MNLNIPSLPFDKNQIQNDLDYILQKAPRIDKLMSLKLAFSCIDMTTLNATDTTINVAGIAQKTNAFKDKFPDIPNLAAICIFPNLVSTVWENLAAPDVKIASVAGGFPSSMTYLELKVEEAKMAVINGADEIDIVFPLWAFYSNDYFYCYEEIKTIKKTIGDIPLKVILESGVLADPVKIWNASFISLEAGADFIKTSTGKMGEGATKEAAYVICMAVKWWQKNSGEKRGVKVAGGISDSSQVMEYLSIVNEILGEEWLDKNLFRIGASKLANNLLSNILYEKIEYF